MKLLILPFLAALSLSLSAAEPVLLKVSIAVTGDTNNVVFAPYGRFTNGNVTDPMVPLRGFTSDPSFILPATSNSMIITWAGSNTLSGITVFSSPLSINLGVPAFGTGSVIRQ
jgi:hypothetical protein